MQLQKGKYQADKNFYQIGRTWDLSELQYIKKLDQKVDSTIKQSILLEM